MCPIQPKFHFLMVFVMDVWPDLNHNSDLLIFSGHLICRICRRYLFRSCSVFLVCFYVSDSYKRADLTLVSTILSLVLRLMFLFLHIGLRVTKANLALPNLDLM